MNDAPSPPGALVLLHGFTGGPQSWHAVLLELHVPQGVDVIAPHLAGHGEQPETLGVDPSNHSFDAEVDRLAHVCVSRGVSSTNRAFMVGYSLGARLGLGLLVRYPHLFERGLLVGVNPGLEDDAERRWRRVHDETLAQKAERLGLDAFLDHWQALPLFDSQAALPETTRRAQALLRRANTAQGLALSLRTCGLGQMPNYTSRLSTLCLPLQLVVGERDERFVGLSERLSRVLTNASLHLVPACGHNVPLEAPAALAALIQAHL